jgi:hypothetical protein
MPSAHDTVTTFDAVMVQRDPMLVGARKMRTALTDMVARLSVKGAPGSSDPAARRFFRLWLDAMSAELRGTLAAVDAAKGDFDE